MTKTTSVIQIVAQVDPLSPTGFHISAVCFKCDDVPLDTDASFDSIIGVVQEHVQEVHGLLF